MDRNWDLGRLLEKTGYGVLCLRDDRELTIEHASAVFYRFLGYRREELPSLLPAGRPPVLLNVTTERKKLLEQIRQNGRARTELELARRDGRLVWAEYCMCLKTKGIFLFCGVTEEISGSRRAQEELAASEERYRRIVENLAASVFDYDFKTGESYGSPAFQETFGVHGVCSGDLWDRMEESGLIYPPMRDEARKWLEDLLREKRPSGTAECLLRAAGGEYIWCSLQASVFYDRRGEPARLTAVLTDIDQRKRETMALRREAEHDLMTGLFNRTTAIRQICGILSQSGSENRHALFVIDIDNFKKVNDCMGHPRGDRLIVETAERIRKLLRRGDVAGRIGGDEFIAFIRDAGSAEILEKAEALRSAFGQIRKSGKFGHSVSGSIGIALYPVDGCTYGELFQRADVALYAAKRCGKDAYRVYMKGIEKLAQIGPDG